MKVLEKLSLPDLLSEFCKRKGLNWEDVKKESARLGHSPTEYLIKIKKVDYEEFLDFFEEVLNSLGIEAKKKYDGKVRTRKGWYAEFEDGSVGVWNAYDYVKALEVFKGKEVYLVPYYFFELKEIKEEDPLKAEFFSLIIHAQNIGATDVHFEVKQSSVEIKFRILGDLIKIKDISFSEWERLQKIIKTLASRWTMNFNPEEWRNVQDARIVIPERKLDLRLAFTPSLKDRLQNLVIRLLYQSQLRIKGIKDLMKLGFLKEDAQKLMRHCLARTGLILETGATGSGKSRTLNTLLALVPSERKILTVEDPVEYILENAVQHQILEYELEGKIVKVGFLEYLREFMRQDPDVILVGEWRKQKELTEAIIYASETGHLVLTTLHTSRSVNTPNLLVSQYGLSREDVSNNVNIIVNQRLVKKVCPYCCEEREITKKDIEKIAFVRMLDREKLFSLVGKRGKFPGKGCEKCTVVNPISGKVVSKGYIGRTAVYEYIEFTYEVRELILKTTSSLEIEKFISEKKVGRTYVDVVLRKIENGEIDPISGIEVLL